VSRYIRKLRHVGSAGPTEERAFAIWAGYDLVGIDDDLSAQGLIRVEDWSPEQLAEYGIAKFLRVEHGDQRTYEKLGISADDEPLTSDP
jgi:hypothetical protein